jgi:hypothetical protein
LKRGTEGQAGGSSTSAQALLGRENLWSRSPVRELEPTAMYRLEYIGDGGKYQEGHWARTFSVGH